MGLKTFRQPGPWLAAWIAWLLLLLVLSSLPGGTLSYHPFDFFDKVQHAVYFAGGAFCLGGWLVTRGEWPARWWFPLLMAAVIGGFDEWRQQFTPGRSALDLWDWLADVTGGVLGTLLIAPAALRRRLEPAARR